MCVSSREEVHTYMRTHTHRRGALTLMPSKRDRALRGLRARSVLRDLMAPSSEYPSMFAVKDTSDTWRRGVDLVMLSALLRLWWWGQQVFSSHVHNEEVQPAPSVGEVCPKSIGDPLQNHLHYKHICEDLIRELQNCLYDDTLLQVNVFKCLLTHRTAVWWQVFDGRCLTTLVLHVTMHTCSYSIIIITITIVITSVWQPC